LLLAHNQLGQAYPQKRLRDEAITELQKAVSLSAGQPDLLAILRVLMLHPGKRAEAQSFLTI